MITELVSFLSGIIGALVGGAASLAGAITVGRLQFTRDARVRIFREIIPEITELTLPAFLDDQASDDRFEAYCACISRLAREAQVAGKRETQAMRNVFRLSTGSEETGQHGTFEFDRNVIAANRTGLFDTLFEMGYGVSRRIR